MARRKSPDPAVTDRWVDVLLLVNKEVMQRREALEQAEDNLGKAVRAAFREGVLVGPMMQATGLSGSRIYQLKWALRDAGLEAEAEVPSVLAGPVVEECPHPRTYGSGPRQGQCTVCHDQVEPLTELRLHYQPDQSSHQHRHQPKKRRKRSARKPRTKESPRTLAEWNAWERRHR